MEGLPSDNAAAMLGFTRELALTNGTVDLFLLVRPDVDLDDMFKAWDTDNQEWLMVNGWLFSVVED